MTKKRLAFKDYQKLVRLIKAVDKANKDRRDWCEKTADEGSFYVDKWIPRVGFYLDDNEKRVRVDEGVTKEARRRQDEANRLADKAEAFLLKLAEAHGTYPDLIDVKTGKIEIPEKGEVLKDVGEEGVDEPKPNGPGADTAGS